ncbi:fasciclin domain-containing protein [Sphingopyxis sp. YF1]|uniref:fasciclin domain-containing protein n=1 Tax=Sphingopyxis sp. YF1 TaxID=2482763 RepID=UPI001F6164D8|nr:fasciclin domain-containing protein [Sphingopyxis sp. YF1]
MTAAALAVPAQARTDEEAASTAAEADAAAESMEGSWNIVQNTTNSPEHTTLAKALAAAGLTGTLSGAGPFTVFAPTDAAFAAVPQPMTDYIMSPDNKWALEQVLTYHVVPGTVTAEDLYKKIKTGGGKAVLKTVEGQEISFTEVQGNIRVEGTMGSSGYVTQPDVAQSNGTVHVLNGVLIPTITPPAAPAADAAEPAAEAAPAAEAMPAT